MGAAREKKLKVAHVHEIRMVGFSVDHDLPYLLAKPFHIYLKSHLQKTKTFKMWLWREQKRISSFEDFQEFANVVKIRAFYSIEFWSFSNEYKYILICI